MLGELSKDTSHLILYSDNDNTIEKLYAQVPNHISDAI